MGRNMQYVLAGILYAGVNLTSLAQRPFTHHYHEEFIQVTNLSQDSSGFLWIGSGELGRFDGYNMAGARPWASGRLTTPYALRCGVIRNTRATTGHFSHVVGS